MIRNNKKFLISIFILNEINEYKLTLFISNNMNAN
jgi:hypothetical protein